MPSTNRLLFSVLPCYLNTMSFGVVIGFTSPLLSKMEAPGEPFYNLPDSAAWFTSIATIGAMLGSLGGGSLVDKLGRRKSIMLTALPYLIGWLAIAFGKTPFTLSYGRFLTGIGIGMTCVVCPMYISEISTKELRGKLGAGFQLCITIGIIISYFFGMYLTWRVLAFFFVFIPAATIAVCMFIMESPRYLLDKGLKAEAYRSLLILRDTSSSAEEELLDMESSTSSTTTSKKLSLSDFTDVSVLRPMKVSLAIMCFQQLTGINIVMFYTTAMFESAGFKKENSDMAACLIGLLQLLFTLGATVLMDKAGRKMLLLVAGFGMGVSCFMMSYCYYQQGSSAQATAQASAYGGTVLVSLMAYICFFSLGWGPVPLVLSSEIFPSKVKGTAMGASVFVSWISAFFVTLFFPVFKATFDMSGVFAIFAFFCFLSVFYVHTSVPETKGKTLEEISTFFIFSRPVRSI